MFSKYTMTFLIAADVGTDFGDQSGFGSARPILDIISYIFMFLLVIGVLYVVLRYLKKYSANLSESKHMRLLDTLPIDNEKRLLLVEVGDRVLLIGAGKELTLLTSVQLNEDELYLIREASWDQDSRFSVIWDNIKEKLIGFIPQREDKDQSFNEPNRQTEAEFEKQLQEELDKLRRLKNEGGPHNEE